LRILPTDPADARSRLLARGWHCREPAHDDGSGIIGVWDHPEHAATFSWVHDDLAGCEYFILGGPDRAATFERLATEVPLTGQEDLLNTMGAVADPEAMGALARKLGLLACGPFDLPVFRVLTGLLHCRQPVLQEHGLVAIGYAAWPQFGLALDRLVNDSGSTKVVREEAARVKAALEASDWNAAYR
jgi:hypothetical protein